MTEYDFSPEGYQRHLDNQARISRWVRDTNSHSSEYKPPFGLRSEASMENVTRSQTSSPSPGMMRHQAQPHEYHGTTSRDMDVGLNRRRTVGPSQLSREVPSSSPVRHSSVPAPSQHHSHNRHYQHYPTLTQSALRNSPAPAYDYGSSHTPAHTLAPSYRHHYDRGIERQKRSHSTDISTTRRDRPISFSVEPSHIHTRSYSLSRHEPASVRPISGSYTTTRNPTRSQTLPASAHTSKQARSSSLSRMDHPRSSSHHDSHRHHKYHHTHSNDRHHQNQHRPRSQSLSNPAGGGYINVIQTPSPTNLGTYQPVRYTTYVVPKSKARAGGYTVIPPNGAAIQVVKL